MLEKAKKNNVLKFKFLFLEVNFRKTILLKGQFILGGIV